MKGRSRCEGDARLGGQVQFICDCSFSMHSLQLVRAHILWSPPVNPAHRLWGIMAASSLILSSKTKRAVRGRRSISRRRRFLGCSSSWSKLSMSAQSVVLSKIMAMQVRRLGQEDKDSSGRAARKSCGSNWLSAVRRRRASVGNDQPLHMPRSSSSRMF